MVKITLHLITEILNCHAEMSSNISYFVGLLDLFRIQFGKCIGLVPSMIDWFGMLPSQSDWLTHNPGLLASTHQASLDQTYAW